MTVEGCGSDSLQGDVRFGEVMALMGAHVQWQPFSITITGEAPALICLGGTVPTDSNLSCCIVPGAASEPCAALAWRVTPSERGLCVLLFGDAWLLTMASFLCWQLSVRTKGRLCM